MKTIMMHFAPGPTHENAGGVFIGNRGCGFHANLLWPPCGRA